MRKIPSALKAHLQQPVTTTCRLLKIKLKDGREFGMSSLDQDVAFAGTTYHAANGFDPSIIATDSSFDIDNSEGFALLSADIPGITPEMVMRGELDDGQWEMLLVNYRDLSQGALLLDAGDLGDVRVVRDSVYIPELVSFAMRLRQSIGHVDGRLCRAIFGSAPADQLGCGVDAEALWLNLAVVATADDDPYHSFFAQFDGAFPYTLEESIPGRVQWLSGDNASHRVYAIELVDSIESGRITLFERMPFPVQIGDTLRFRPDCDKRFVTCRDRWNNMLNFKGEPLIPVSDGTEAQTPGATV